MFSERLKRLRNNKNLPQQYMADLLGITRQGYGKYENGSSQPSFEMLQKIADYFEVSTDYLLGRSSHPKLDAAKDKEVDEEVEELLALIEAMPEDKRSAMEMKILAYARGLADATDD